MNRRAFLASAAASSSLSAEEAHPLLLLTYDHCGLTRGGIPQLLNSRRTAAAWLDKYPGFRAGIENEARTYDYLAEHEPKILDELRGYLTQPCPIHSDSVIATALYPRGGKAEPRLHEYRGIAASTEPPVRTTEVDLEGKSRGDAHATIQFRPWQFRAFRFGQGAG